MAEAIAAAVLWVSTNAAFVYFVVTVAVSIYGSSQARRAAEDAAEQARQEFNAGLKERTITRIATDASFRYVYGRARVGSNIVAMFTSGDKDQYKHLVCVHADHECEAYEAIFINGNELGTLDTDGWVTAGDKYWSARTESVTENFSGLTHTLVHPPIAGTVQCYDYVNIGDGAGMMSWQPTPFTISGNVVTLTTPATTPKVVYKWLTGTPRVNVKKHLGTPADTADAYLMSVVPDKWKDTAVLRGKCYSVITLDLNEAEFQGGIVPIEVLLKGKKIYDVRDGVTRWSDNPALAVYDYLTSPLCNVPVADLPVSSFITAANVCDETSTSVVNFGNTLGGVAGINTSLLNKAYAALAANKKYTINGTVTSDQDKSKVLEMMTQCMAGGLVSTTWDIWAGKYVAPVAALYQEDVVGAVAITPGISDADIFNGVKGQYIDPMNMYVATDYEPFQNATYLAVDGRDLFNSIDFPFSDNAQRVHNLCRIFTEDHRNSYTIKANFSLKAWPLKVGQRVTFTSSFFGQTAKVFRITDKTFSPESMVELTLKEDDPSIWDDADALTPEATLNTNLQNPFAIAPITGLAASSGSDSLLLQADGTVVSRVHLVWNATTTQAVSTNGLIEIEWQQIGSDVWQKIQASGNEVSAYISDVQDGRYYIIRARTVNPYLNVKSDWSYLTHQVVGKTDSPPDVASMTIKIKADGTRQYTFDTTGQPADVRSGGGYRIKYRLAGTSTAWADMIPLHTGLLTQSPYETNQPLPGVYDFGIEAVDSNGNGSLGAYLVSDVVMTDGDFTDAKTETAVAADVVEGFIARINALISANKAETAQATADAATADITNIVSDSVLAKGEKSTVILDYNAILGEQAGIDAQATALSITTEKTAYDNAVTALTTYLTGITPAYNDTTTNTPIVATTFRQKFVDVYTAKQVLMNMFASKASTLATWTGIVGQSGTISTGNIASIVGSNAIGTAYIADQAIATAKLADNAATDTVSLSSTGQDPTTMNSSLTVSYTPPNSCVATLSLAGGTSTSTGAGIGGSSTFQTPLTVGFTQGGSALGPAAPINLQGNGSLATQYDGMINLSIKVSLTAGVPYTFGVSLTNGRYLAPSVSYGVLSNSLVLKLEVIKK